MLKWRTTDDVPDWPLSASQYSALFRRSELVYIFFSRTRPILHRFAVIAILSNAFYFVVLNLTCVADLSRSMITSVNPLAATASVIYTSNRSIRQISRLIDVVARRKSCAGIDYSGGVWTTKEKGGQVVKYIISGLFFLVTYHPSLPLLFNHSYP
jgi:hypothetical protein